MKKRPESLNDMVDLRGITGIKLRVFIENPKTSDREFE